MENKNRLEYYRRPNFTHGEALKKPSFDRWMNIIAAELVAQPKIKYLFLRGMENVNMGKRVMISPGTRIENSSVGDDVNIGIKVNIKDTVIHERVYLTANVDIINCEIGKGSIIGANAYLEDVKVPPGMLVTGTGKMEPVTKFQNKSSHRNTIVVFFDDNPM